jgi:GTP-binding protein EngB required for normal cell division
MKQANQLKRLDEEGRRVEEEDTKSESLVDCMQTHCSVGDKLDENENCITEESVDDVGNQSVQYWNSTMSISHREFRHHETSIDMDCATETPPPDDIENDQLNNQRIAEFFVDEKNRCAELIKKGQPNVYLLNATDTSVSEDLRWFDVGRPVRSPPTCMKNHKLIILMGATGCGKSTLINGMVNYILGVKWNDPFRFKCVREDETTARNQAISQTSSVTAYTIRHRNGMAVPYSITIIDTPGYGDTRGVKRDKEITRNIQQFLTQQESRVEEIHAACFVAASGDSRLTTTQKYIIDSALSIFGKDIKENIRLLVTFADNADPPVVEACRAGNFPVTSVSAGIIFSKFNSSVLYASTEQQEEDLCFDELFWDMGQENFSKFFSMLEGMNGRNLESTREVIQRRTLLEESLKDIEQELEVCLFNIENIETFQRKMKECGQKMESSKHFAIENMKICYSRVPCQNGFYAYNCRNCQKTCESPIYSANPTKLPKQKKFCSHLACAHPSSEHDYEQVEIRRTTKKTKKTLLDMKAKFESSSNEKMTNERLLTDCSENLEVAKAKVFSLLDQVGENVRSLESTALRSNTLSPTDYLSLMRSRVAEEQKPGYQIRLETLSELQQSLADDEAAKSQWFYPIQTSQLGIRGSSRGSRRRVFRPSSFTRSNSK